MSDHANNVRAVTKLVLLEKEKALAVALLAGSRRVMRTRVRQQEQSCMISFVHPTRLTMFQMQ